MLLCEPHPPGGRCQPDRKSRRSPLSQDNRRRLAHRPHQHLQRRPTVRQLSWPTPESTALPGSHLRAAACPAAWVLARPGRAPLPAQSARFPSSTHERGAPTFGGHRVRRLSTPRRRKPTASFRRSLPSRTVPRLGLGLIECPIGSRTGHPACSAWLATRTPAGADQMRLSRMTIWERSGPTPTAEIGAPLRDSTAFT